MKRFIRSVRFVPARHVLCRQVPFFSLILLLLMPTGYSIAKPKPVEAGMTQQENALQMRKKNRERLMAKVKKTDCRRTVNAGTKAAGNGEKTG
ncbi:Uncharacterised protein [Citrobacter koseri]|nr:Uncharacterised protein [Citrobacter koseri]